MTNLPEQKLVSDIRFLIDQTKGKISRILNQEMTLTVLAYWKTYIPRYAFVWKG